MGMVREFAIVTAVILETEQDSDAIVVGDYAQGSVQAPAAITGTEVTFKVSNDGTNFNALENDIGAAVAAVPISAGEAVPMPDAVFKYKFAKVRSNAAEGADRNLTIFIKA